ncbi:MAG: hypothetical protein L0241_06185 [Planctomycetia bacterium]|nr:hypothetical protein [Planctomycetia bacterium]
MTELTPEPNAAPSSPEPVVPEGIQRARAAFLRDFPRLIADRRMRGKYVCYHGDTLISVSKDYWALIREAITRKIPEDAYLVFQVVPGEDIEERAMAEEAELP